jgi:ABC-2 type transport system ATP-binding protein
MVWRLLYKDYRRKAFPMKSIISAKNISKSFISGGETVKALDSVNIEIKEGEIFGLLGPNGSGKTTLISILCGFLIPDSGDATIFGTDCTQEPEKIQKKMNFVSGFSGITEYFSAMEMLHYYCMLYNLGNAAKRVEKALKQTNLEKYKNRTAAEFSSGLRRRILISKALLNDPQVLLLDEPTVGLDVEAAASLRLLIKKMKKQGRTILLTTHNMKEAEGLCDRVGLISEGRIIECGTFSELKKRFFPLEVLHVRCNNPEKIEKLLSKRKRIARTKISENAIKIFLKENSDIEPILNIVMSSNAGIKSINTIEPELEDIYIKLIPGGANE